MSKFLNKKTVLYHYVHCPFCVRVRVALSFLDLQYESIVLPYDDELTPIKMTGVKMLPIWGDGKVFMNESLDIIRKIDVDDLIEKSHFSMHESHITDLLNKIGECVYPLAMPYWVYTPEFDDQSRKYFQTKKEKKRGPFNALVLNKKKYIKDLSILFEAIEKELLPFYKSDTFTLTDILIYSHLVGLYVVPGMLYPSSIGQYFQRIENTTGFSYHEPFWKNNKIFTLLMRGNQ